MQPKQPKQPNHKKHGLRGLVGKEVVEEPKKCEENLIKKEAKLYIENTECQKDIKDKVNQEEELNEIGQEDIK